VSKLLKIINAKNEMNSTHTQGTTYGFLDAQYLEVSGSGCDLIKYYLKF